MERRGLPGPPHCETDTLLLWLNTVNEPTSTWHNSDVSRQRGTNCNKQRQSKTWPSSVICPSSSPTTRLMYGLTAISSNSMKRGCQRWWPASHPIISRKVDKNGAQSSTVGRLTSVMVGAGGGSE